MVEGKDKLGVPMKKCNINMCHSRILKKLGNLKTPERYNLPLDIVPLEISGGPLFLQR